jgi:hypothetical protein
MTAVDVALKLIKAGHLDGYKILTSIIDAAKKEI